MPRHVSSVDPARDRDVVRPDVRRVLHDLALIGGVDLLDDVARVIAVAQRREVIAVRLALADDGKALLVRHDPSLSSHRLSPHPVQ